MTAGVISPVVIVGGFDEESCSTVAYLVETVGMMFLRGEQLSVDEDDSDEGDGCLRTSGTGDNGEGGTGDDVVVGVDCDGGDVDTDTVAALRRLRVRCGPPTEDKVRDSLGGRGKETV